MVLGMGWESPPRIINTKKISHLYGIYWVYIIYHISQCRLIFSYLLLMVQQSGQTPVEKLVIHMSRCLKNQGLHQMGVSSCIFKGVHPGRLTWNLQITHLERKMIFQTSMIMFHVNLPGCIFQGVSMGCGCGAASRQHLSFHLVAMARPSLVNFHCNKAPTHCYSETQIMDRLLEMSECLDRTLRNATGRLLGEPSADNFCFSLPPASLIQLAAFNSGFSSPPLISWRSGFVGNFPG